ncbi:MAG: DMT family transporter [Deltaproteobacteria bacterium]|nr:DMT family transporter [Deltaproteobacteria bacterium]MBW1994180.1 DMT family transporter [Deltaproteobacteria bacterium]
MKSQVSLETTKEIIGLDLRTVTIMIIICSAWGLNHPLTKMAYVDISPILAAAIRSLLATAGLLIYCLTRDISLKMEPGGQLHVMVLGLVFGIEFVFFYVGIDMTLASRGAVLLYSQPFFTALMAHLFLAGDNLNWIRLMGLVLAFFGIAVVMGDTPANGRHSLMGDFFCLTAGFLWAGTTIYIRKFMVSRASAVQTLFYELLYSFPVLLAAAFLFEHVRFDPTMQLISILLYQGLGVACISYLIFIGLLYRYRASTLAAFTFIAPVTGVVFSGLILTEPLTLYLWLGVVLVSAGLWLVNNN